MSTLDELARLRTRLGGTDLVHLERLVAGWRPLADLSFADLVLLAPIAGPEAVPAEAFSEAALDASLKAA